MRTGENSGWNLDKARGLMWLISLIKNGFIKFFQYDTTESGKLGLVDDFLSLDWVGGGVHTVIKKCMCV
jgi:hypothetical protein